MRERTHHETGLPSNRLSLLSELGRQITSSLDVTTVLQSIVDGACHLTDARYGALLTFDSSGRVQEFFTIGITAREQRRIGGPPQGRGLLGWVQQNREPLRLADISQHPQAAGFPANHPPMKTLLGVPILDGNKSPSSLYVADKAQGAEFSQEDQSLLLLFADQAAVAIRNARLYSQVETERQRLDAILTDTPNGMVYIDKTTGQLQANRRAEEMLECPLDPPESLALLEERCRTAGGAPIPHGEHPLDRALKGELIAGEEFLIVRPNGTSLPVLCSASPVYNSRKETMGAVIRFRDIAPIKEYQQRIEELAAERGRLLESAEQERQRLEALIDTSPVGVFVAEANSGRVVLVNREAQRILSLSYQPNYDLETLQQAAVCRRPDGTLYEAEELPIQRALSRGETVRAEEVRFELPDGHTVPTIMNATPVYSGRGRITAAIAVVQDITPLEELEQLRSEFLGMVSHELKTPLTAIKGSAATVLGSRRPFSPEEMRELFEIVDDQADRLRDLVDNILDMTRIEAGSMSVNAKPVKLRHAVDEALATLTRTGNSHDVHIEMAEDLPLVKADHRRIVQVLGNLLSNASKFSPATSPITIEVTSDPETLTVHVRDQGRGIPAEKLPHLFRKFSRVHDDSEGGLSGSGLGLAICKGIVEAHGGRIWADSPGERQGATFSFTLPVAVEEAVVASQPDTTQRAQLLGRVHRTGERTRILAVDDEPQILRLLQRSLSQAGYQVVATDDSSQVLDLVEQEEPDLVLLDLLLPGASGFDLLQRIREFSGVPVIFLTASSSEEDAVKALSMGADDYVTKPFSPSELVARIGTALRHHALPDTLDVRPPLAIGDLSINFVERRVSVSGRPVFLSATEYKLLYELATHAGRVLTHDQILHSVWGEEYSGETDLVRSFVRNLRRKLGDDARNPRYIFTEPQVGYRMPTP